MTKHEHNTESGTSAIPAIPSNKVVGFDMGAAEELAAAEEQGIDVEFEDALGRVCYQEDGRTPITVNVCGSLSKRYRKVQAIQRGRVLKRAQTRVSANSANGADDQTEEALGEQNLNEQTEAVAACINGWSAGLTDKGRPFPFSRENALRLITLNPRMQAKLERKMDEHSAFFGASSNGSKLR